MADFPGKVNTQTSSAASQQRNITMPVDVSFIKTIPAILMMIEIVVGLLVWALVASVRYYFPAVGWVLFVTITFWILTTVLFFILLLGVYQKLPSVPWPLALLIYNAVTTFLYLTAFITTSAVANSYWHWYYGYGNMVAAALFACLVTLAYGASTYFAVIEWKGNGGNAAGATVPV